MSCSNETRETTLNDNKHLLRKITKKTTKCTIYYKKIEHKAAL